jgi:peptidoglycan-associated lipoprotein
MKLTKFSSLMAVALMLGAGCAHKTPPVTDLGKSGGGKTGSGPGSGLTAENSGATGSTNDNITSTGIPAGPGHEGWTKDPDMFKADTVHFDYDSSVVRADEKSKVAAVADYLKSNSANAVEIQGNCDERGTDEYNRSLGERRALALREEMVRLGIDPNRVDTISFGRDHPVDTGHTEAAHKKNRRGDFVLLTPPK